MSIHGAVNPVPAFEARSLAVSHCIGITALMSGVEAYGIGGCGRSSFGEANAEGVYNIQEKCSRRSRDGNNRETRAWQLGYRRLCGDGLSRLSESRMMDPRLSVPLHEVSSTLRGISGLFSPCLQHHNIRMS